MPFSAQQLLDTYCQLEQAQTEFAGDWRDAETFCLPQRVNRSVNRLCDTSGVHAARDFAAGVFANTYTPGELWFAVEPEEDLDDDPDVVRWLGALTEKAHSLLNASNFPVAFQQSLLHAAVNGNGCLFVGMMDGRLYFRAYTVPAVKFRFSPVGALEYVFRELMMTPAEAVAEFGSGAVSEKILKLWKENQLCQDKFKFIHAVFPRKDRDAEKKDASNAPYASVYIDVESSTIASEGGYTSMPYSVLRFYDTDTDYGVGPGVACLADLRYLNQLGSDIINAIEMGIAPPCFVPGGVNQSAKLVPGAVIPYDPSQGTPQFMSVGADIATAYSKEQSVKDAIRDGFFVSQLYALSMAQMQERGNPQKTATEVRAVVDEKLMAIAPMVSRLHCEFLNGVVERALTLMVDNRMLPADPPQALLESGSAPIRIRYNSRLASRLNEVMGNSLLGAMGKAGQLLQLSANSPGLDEVVNIPRAVEKIVTAANVPSDVLLSTKEIADIRAAKAEAAQQAQQAEMQASMMKPLDMQKRTEAGSPLEELAKTGGGLPNA